MTMTMAGTISRTMAIAVRRCCQKSLVPARAEPRPRTRPSGVRIDFEPLIADLPRRMQ